MDIKNSAVTAKMVIHSLLALLENENVDISSVKFKVGSDGNGYESPEFELEKLVSLAIDGLVEIEEGNAVPEGFVLVPKELSDEKADIQASLSWSCHLGLFKSQNRDMSATEIEEFKLKWCRNKARDLQEEHKAMIEAQEQSHE